MGYASYHPFKDTLDLFRYRVTASYYMCWYTDLREESLAFPDTYPCFKDLEKTTEANGNRIHDFRSRVATGRGKNQRYSMFTCSYSFVIFLFSAFAAPALSRSCLLQIFVALSK
jgi:hypothetical protein